MEYDYKIKTPRVRISEKPEKSFKDKELPFY